MAGIAQWFLDQRMADGGWNCEWVEGSARSSFHSTLNALRGLLCYEDAIGGCYPVRAARRGGEEYLLQRRLLRILSTGEHVGGWVTRFAYPFRWFSSVLNAADYFRTASRYDDGPPDPRLAEGDRGDPGRPPARRHVAAGTPTPGSGLVRGRRTLRRSLDVADLLRQSGPRLVGRDDRQLSKPPWTRRVLAGVNARRRDDGR